MLQSVHVAKYTCCKVHMLQSAKHKGTSKRHYILHFPSYTLQLIHCILHIASNTLIANTYYVINFYPIPDPPPPLRNQSDRQISRQTSKVTSSLLELLVAAKITMPNLMKKTFGKTIFKNSPFKGGQGRQITNQCLLMTPTLHFKVILEYK